MNRKKGGRKRRSRKTEGKEREDQTVRKEGKNNKREGKKTKGLKPGLKFSISVQSQCLNL